MKRALSPAVRAMRPGVFAELQARIDARAASGADLVPLHIGDTCAPLPRLDTAWSDPSTLGSYGATAGLAELRCAYAERLLARGFGPATIDPARNVLIGAGATHAISCAARAILHDGDEVLLLSPYWPLAHGILSMCGARAIEVPFTDQLYRAHHGEQGAEFDVAATLEAHRTDRTTAIYVITPNNPDGKVLSPPTLEAIAEFAARYDLWILSDEAYADWVYQGTHRSIARARAPGSAERTISAYSASKSHALAGARIGCVVANEEVIAAARRVSVHSVFNVPVAMQRAALAALRGDGSWSEQVLKRYRAARDRVVEALTGHDFFVPDGGAYVFVDLTRKLGGRPLGGVLARAVDEGVVVTPGDAFGDAYRNHVRICFTSVGIERVLEGIARLDRALAAD